MALIGVPSVNVAVQAGHVTSRILNRRNEKHLRTLGNSGFFMYLLLQFLIKYIKIEEMFISKADKTAWKK